MAGSPLLIVLPNPLGATTLLPLVNAISPIALVVVLVPLAVPDFSFTLHGSLTDLMLAGTAPGLIATSFSVQAMRVLEGGGRAALCLAVGVTILARLRPADATTAGEGE